MGIAGGPKATEIRTWAKDGIAMASRASANSKVRRQGIMYMVLPLARSFFVLPGLARTAAGCVNEGQTWYEKLYTAIRWIEMPAEAGRFIWQFALRLFGISCSLPFGREVLLPPAQLLRLAEHLTSTLAENHRIGGNRPPEPPLAGHPRCGFLIQASQNKRCPQNTRAARGWPSGCLASCKSEFPWLALSAPLPSRCAGWRTTEGVLHAFPHLHAALP